MPRVADVRAVVMKGGAAPRRPAKAAAAATKTPTEVGMGVSGGAILAPLLLGLGGGGFHLDPGMLFQFNAHPVGSNFVQSPCCRLLRH